MSEPLALRFKLGAILLAALALFLAGNRRVDLFDRDEPRYAQCSRQMLESGDWVVPMYLDHWRVEKPPLIYWCQATAMRLFGDDGGSARLPSTLAIIAVAALIAWFGPGVIGSRRTLWTLFIFCTSALVIATAKFSVTDPTLLLFLVIGQACLLRMWHDDRQGRPTPLWVAPAFWIATSLGGLTKGPIILGEHAMLMIVLALFERPGPWKSLSTWKTAMRWWLRTRPILGIPIVILIVGPWLYLIHQRAPGFLSILLHRAKQHATSSMEGHKGPPGYYLVLVWGTYFPWSLLLPTAIGFGIRHRREPAVRFAMAALIGPWLLAEIVRTKLPHYFLPCVVPLAFLTADALVRCLDGKYDDFRRRAFRIGMTIWSAVVIALAIGAAGATHKLANLPSESIRLLALAAFVYAGVVLTLAWTQRVSAMSVTLGVGMMVIIGILYNVVLPSMSIMRLSRLVADDLIAQHAYGPTVRVAMIDYKEPSLAFDQGGGVREQDDGYLTATPPQDWPNWIVLTAGEWNTVPPDRKALLEIVSSHRGLMYAGKGRLVDVLLLRKR